MALLTLESKSRQRVLWSGLPLASLSLFWLSLGVASFASDQDHSSDRQVANWWAFQPSARHPIPQVDDPRWSQHPIDAFIKAKLDQQGLVPAPPADKRTLVRRLYLDLIGLLPPPAAVTAFVADASPDALNRLVDRLLASPHYGERWGRHWLDLARYADSGGYEQDYDNPNAWRYRDYVIGALNGDKAYNQFVVEQLAGDELDQVTFDSLIATGFNRIGPRVGFREKDNPQYRYEYLDDMIGTTSQVFLGLTVQCARCHDHKFDPIPQLDYYRLMAIFFPFVNYDFPLVSPDKVAEYEGRKAVIETQVKSLKQRIADIERPARRRALEKKLDAYPQHIQIAVRTPEAERSPGQKLLAAQMLSLGTGGVSSLLGAAERDEISQLRRQIDQLERRLPQPLPLAMGIRDGDYRFAPDGPGDQKLPGKGNRETVNFVWVHSFPRLVDHMYHLRPTFCRLVTTWRRGRRYSPVFYKC